MPVRNLLRLNAIFSGVSGLALALLNRPLAEVFGISRGIVATIGVALIVYAADLSITAVRRGLRRSIVLMFATADAAWVLGGLAVLLAWPDTLSIAGRLALAATIVPVAAFAALQFRGARRLT